MIAASELDKDRQSSYSAIRRCNTKGKWGRLLTFLQERRQFRLGDATALFDLYPDVLKCYRAR